VSRASVDSGANPNPRLPGHSEKQLKHILQKWRAKKNVSNEDMQIMLAIKKKRKEDGQGDTAFTYYGHPVNEQKLRREEQKYKTLDEPPSGETEPEYLVNEC
jgi:hypothetical protein